MQYIPHNQTDGPFKWVVFHSGEIKSYFYNIIFLHHIHMGRRGRDHMVVVSSNPAQAYSIQHYVIKFVSHLQQVCGFLQILWFPPSIKLTTTI